MYLGHFENYGKIKKTERNRQTWKEMERNGKEMGKIEEKMEK